METRRHTQSKHWYNHFLPSDVTGGIPASRSVFRVVKTPAFCYNYPVSMHIYQT